MPEHHPPEWPVRSSPTSADGQDDGEQHPARLRPGEEAAIHAVHYQVNLTEGLDEAVIVAGLEIAASMALTLSASLRVDGHELLPAELVHLEYGRNALRLRPVRIVNPRLWWPAGHGHPCLYRMELTLCRRQDDPDALRDRRDLGIRRVRLLPPSADANHVLDLEMNGRPVPAQITPWSPPDAVPQDMPPERLAALLAELCESRNDFLLHPASADIYESDHFHDCCDRLGIMVMHDLTGICAHCRKDESRLAAIRTEIMEHLCRLRHHPSMVLLKVGHEQRIPGRRRPPRAQPPKQRRRIRATDSDQSYSASLTELCAQLIPDIPCLPAPPANPATTSGSHAAER